MNIWIWMLIGFVVFPVALAILAVGTFGAWCLSAWFSWKTRQIRCRREWTTENPYWREAFDDGVKWAREQQAQPMTSEDV